LRDLVLLRDFFHSLAIISALFLASLFAISFLWKVSSSDLGFEGAEEDEGWAIVYDCWVKNKGATLGFL